MKIVLRDILLQIANFAVLFLVLNKFLYKPIIKILEGRSKKIQSGLEAAEKSLEDQAKTEERQKGIIDQAEQKASEILEKSRADAKIASREIVDSAKTEAREAVAKEHKILQGKILEEEKRVKKSLASMIIKTTQSILEGALSSSDQKKIINQQIKKIK